LGGKKGIRPVKKLSGGMLAWLCFQIGFTFLVLPFWCQLTRVVPDKIQEGCKTVASSFGIPVIDE